MVDGPAMLPPLDGTARTSRTFETAAGQIRALIAQGHLKPGDKLPPERDLSARLGVGRNAVREALRGLEQAGVVELRPGKGGGAFVTGGRPDVLGRNLRDLLELGSITFDNLWEARLTLVDAVLELAVGNMTEADFAALEANLAQAQACYAAGDLTAKSRRNIEFHDTLARATHNPLIAAIMVSVSDLVRGFTERLGSDPGPKTLESRARLLKALKTGDVHAAQAEMRSDLRRVHRFYRSLERNGRERA
jgi:GntR family transcriptional regulator, transcriptional repressor for pyruvate dehydrogenase complex